MVLLVFVTLDPRICTLEDVPAVIGCGINFEMVVVAAEEVVERGGLAINLVFRVAVGVVAGVKVDKVVDTTDSLVVGSVVGSVVGAMVDSVVG